MKRFALVAAVTVAVFGGLFGSRFATLPVVPPAVAATTADDSGHHAVLERERHHHRRGHR